MGEQFWCGMACGLVWAVVLLVGAHWLMDRFYR